MNSFLRKMGVPAAWEINDVYGLEPELLSMLPQPVLALLLLFPINDKAQRTQPPMICRYI
jgi:ubiquitin carboxyl-terminal hydrolase L3